MVSPPLTNIIDKRLLTSWYAESPSGSWVSVSVLLARTLSSSVDYNPWATVHLSVCSPTPSAVCPRSHLWHRELPDAIHTAKPLVPAFQNKPTTIPIPTPTPFWAIPDLLLLTHQHVKVIFSARWSRTPKCWKGAKAYLGELINHILRGTHC